MFSQILIGSLIASLTVVVEAAFLSGAIRALDRAGSWLAAPPHFYKTIVAIVCITLWLLAALSVAVWIWAAAYVGVGAFESLEPALYFSVVAFTTLGFGDITLPVEWRLLSGVSAANGLLLFGLSTAFLVEFLKQLSRAQSAAVE